MDSTALTAAIALAAGVVAQTEAAHLRSPRESCVWLRWYGLAGEAP